MSEFTITKIEFLELLNEIKKDGFAEASLNHDIDEFLAMIPWFKEYNLHEYGDIIDNMDYYLENYYNAVEGYHSELTSNNHEFLSDADKAFNYADKEFAKLDMKSFKGELK